MSKRAILAATAIVFGSFSPVFTATSAYAAVTVLDSTPAAEGADATTLAAMELQCDALATAHGPAWNGDLDESSITPSLVSGPTEFGTHSIDDAIAGTLVGAGTFTPGTVSILGDPYRNGGSVNMFGVLQADGGSYSNSQYDFIGQFNTTYSYAFNCNMTETVPVQGFYTNNGTDPSEDEGSCQGLTPNNPHWGQNIGNCTWNLTEPGGEQERDDEAGTPIEQTQTDELLAHEDFGEGFAVDETVLIGQAVICISPSKTGPKGVPGTWTKQNGYTGDKCTTDWFLQAPWGHGSQDSNGTYISVPLT